MVIAGASVVALLFCLKSEDPPLEEEPLPESDSASSIASKSGNQVEGLLVVQSDSESNAAASDASAESGDEAADLENGLARVAEAVQQSQVVA